MSAQLQKLTGAWSTDVLPTKTTLTHIDPAQITGVVETLLSASSAYSTMTKRLDLYHLARDVKGAKASLSVISAEHYIATATATQDLPLMTQIIWNATMELQDFEMGFNLYQMKLSTAANALFAVIFAVLLLSHTSLFVWKQYVYFGVCFVLGTGLEFAGYVARLLSIDHYSDKSRFLCQIISLTLAPALIMAGVYFLLAQLLVIYGRQYSSMKPLWFSYIFVFCDICSLVIQAAGGGLAAMSLQNLESTKPGTHVMLSGIAFQVASMTLFIFFLLQFVWKIFFRASPDVKFSMRNLFGLLFQTKHGRALQHEHLFHHYNPKFTPIWSRPVFGFYPLAIFVGVLFVYVRCIYRVVELQEGWTGYLITHEEYVMTLDGMMILLTCLLFIPFHPGFMMGKGANISVANISHRDDENCDKATAGMVYGYGHTTHNGHSADVSDCDSDSSREKSAFDTDSTWESGSQGGRNPYYVPRISVLDSGSSTPMPSPHEFFKGHTTEIPTLDPRTAHSAHTMPPVQTDAAGTGKETGIKGTMPEEVTRKEKSKWASLGRKNKTKPASYSETVGIPYDATVSQPMSAQSSICTKKKTKFTQNNRASRTDSSLVVNPYTRRRESMELATSGPYEMYGRSEVERANSEEEALDEESSESDVGDFVFDS